MGLWKRLCSKSCFGKAISWPTAESLDVELAWGYCLCSRSPFPTAGMQREMWKWLGWRSEEARRVCMPGGIAHFRLDAVRVRLASLFHCHSKKMSKTPLTSCVPRSTYPPGADLWISLSLGCSPVRLWWGRKGRGHIPGDSEANIKRTNHCSPAGSDEG
ncbi:hypothetical protein QQF64_024160 [Cirrhinus molitorella]|uniref:Uncharacterized protein n=1 Tax=Cirrhinus molitorella TaxID=172907 RepID=A0ABR3NKF4_9TELE